MSTLLPCEVHSRFDDPSPVEFCRMCHETTAAALRSRVEALEGQNRDLAHSLAASRADHTTLCRLVDALWDGTDDAAGALSDEQRRLLPMCRDLARAALQPDKGERCETCGGSGRQCNRVGGHLLRGCGCLSGRTDMGQCAPCPDCSEAP